MLFPINVVTLSDSRVNEMMSKRHIMRFMHWK